MIYGIKVHKQFNTNDFMISINELSIIFNETRIEFMRNSNFDGCDMFVISYNPNKIRKFCRITNQLRDFK